MVPRQRMPLLSLLLALPAAVLATPQEVIPVAVANMAGAGSNQGSAAASAANSAGIMSTGSEGGSILDLLQQLVAATPAMLGQYEWTWRDCCKDLQVALCITFLLGLLVIMFASVAACAARNIKFMAATLPLVHRISLFEDRTEQAVARGLAEGRRMRWFNKPRLRMDWERLMKDKDHLRGQVMNQERLWGVIVTMGIANLRDMIMANNDVFWYVLIFFCFYDIVMASIMYSTRFNDTDLFHRGFWTIFAVGLVGQCAYQNHNLSGFAMASSFQYFLIAAAQVRVAIHLPKARFLALHDATWNFIAALLFVPLVLGLDAVIFAPYVLLASHAMLRPMSFLTFWWLTRTKELQRERDVPVNIWYLLARFEGLYVMMIVCSILFPLGLSGVSFMSSGWNAMAVLLGNLYALLFKTSLDTLMNMHEFEEHPAGHSNEHTEKPDNMKYHAIRYGSRVRALIYLVIFPYGVLGIALTGVGLVSTAKGTMQELQVALLCCGPFITWFFLTLSAACHGDRAPKIHFVRLTLEFLAAFAFLLPWYLGMTAFATLCFVCGVMASLLACQVALSIRKEGGRAQAWKWEVPRALVPLPPSPDAKDEDAEDTSKDKISHDEHLFTVLLAVAILKLNLEIGLDHNVSMYVVRTLTFIVVILSTVRYASRFNGYDFSHKLKWSLFEVMLLLMLEGLSADSDFGNKFFCAATAGMFLVLAFAFSYRAGMHNPEARAHCNHCALCHCISACLFIAAIYPGPQSGVGFACQMIAVVLQLAMDPLFAVWITIRETPGLSVHMSRGYVVSRIDGLFMEALGVAVFVPNAIYPNQYTHSALVIAGDFLAVKFASSIKTVIFDVAPLEKRNHAINLGHIPRLLFFFCATMIMVSLAMFGASIPLVTASAGKDGLWSREPFCQWLMCVAACLFWTSLASIKLLHHYTSNRRVHEYKALHQLIGAILSCLPLLPGAIGPCMTDICCLTHVVLVAQILESQQFYASALDGSYFNDSTTSLFPAWMLPTGSQKSHVDSRREAPDITVALLREAEVKEIHWEPDPELRKVII